jgi:hypothetical protein
MNNKEKSIALLESVAHWMGKSGFDYRVKDLKEIFNEVLYEYDQYLQEKVKNE